MLARMLSEELNDNPPPGMLDALGYTPGAGKTATVLASHWLRRWAAEQLSNSQNCLLPLLLYACLHIAEPR